MPNTKRKTTRQADERYASFLRALDLKWIALIESSFAIDRRKYFENEENKLSVEWGSEVEHIGTDYFEGRATLRVTLHPKAKGNKLPFTLNGSFVVHIHRPEGDYDAFIRKFVESEIRLVVWPYFREYVSSVCGRMHVPPLFIPMIWRG